MNKITISDFIKLTGSTLKTVNYYHKIGLLAEPKRSAGGYRLYGPAELNRMRFIKHLKSLGMNLKQIKQIAGNMPNPKTSLEVMESLHHELQNEKRILEERLAKIETLLREGASPLDEDFFDSPSFQISSEILGADQMEKYASTCPEIYKQHHKLCGILDGFQWGEDHLGGFSTLAEYFKTHPAQYQLALESGTRWEELLDVSEDDPRIDSFARESAAFVKSMPQVKELICTHQGMNKPLESLYQGMVAGVLSPAQLRFRRLFEKFLLSEDE